MHTLTPAAEQAVQQLSQRFGVSIDAVKTLLAAVNTGGGTMAQFYHPELGGGGQWMRGGMTMVGDMFNSGLQATVANLCSALSELLASMQVYPPLAPIQGASGGWASNNWWPGDLGSPSSTGGQNDTRYDVFPNTRRLALQSHGQVTIYDTLDHQIGGVQQQQGGYPGSLSFSSQYGTFTVDSLPQLSPAPAPAPMPERSYPTQNPAPAAYVNQGAGAQYGSSDEILQAIEKLGRLAQSGVLTDDEFRVKKAELLARL